MKQAILIALLLPACTGTQADMIITAGSKHSRPTTEAGREYNEFNPGVGVHVTTNDWLQRGKGWRKGIVAATFRNSFEKQSVLAGGTYEYCYGAEYHVCGGAIAGVATGYGGVKPVIAPTAEVGTGRVSLAATVFPADKLRTLVGVIMLKIKLAEW